MGKLSPSVGEIQGQLRQMLEMRKDLTSKERYALMSAIETMDFLKVLSPGLRKAVDQGKKIIRDKQG